MSKAVIITEKKNKGFFPLFWLRKIKDVFLPQKAAGFTLIELLVVVAIIGILVTIVVFAIGGARAEGQNASIMKHLAQVRSQAELINNETGSYLDVCDGNNLNNTYPDLSDIRVGVEANDVNITCNSSTEAYCVSSELHRTNDFYCLDFSGAAGRVPGPPNPCEAGFSCR